MCECVCVREITNQVKGKGSVLYHDSSSFAAYHQSTIYPLLSEISCMSA